MATNTGYIDFNEAAAPATPAANKARLYVKADGLFYSKDDAGVETLVSGGAGGGSGLATDTLWDAAGDLVVGTGADTAAKLTLGATGKAPVSNGSTLVYSYPPGYEFDYAQTTSVATISATTEATANTIVSGAAVSYDGSTVVLIEAFIPEIYTSTVVTEDLLVCLFDGSTSLGLLMDLRTNDAGRTLWSGTLQRRLTPSAASHTYSIRAYVSSANTGGAGGGAGGTGNLLPAFIRQTKV